MLTDAEIKKLAELLAKIPHPEKGLPQPVFDALLRVVPFIACEVVIKSKDGLLMTWRDDKNFHGWHFPGGLMRVEEEWADRISIVAKNELGIKIKNFKFLFPINFNGCHRGHVVSLVFLCEIEGLPNKGKFFKSAPKDTIAEHLRLWEGLKEMKII